MIHLNTGFLTDAGRDYFGELRDHIDWLRQADDENDLPRLGGGSGTLSNFAEVAVLEHITGRDNAAWANLSPIYMALCTTVPDSAKTGTTIVEAAYTGYARKELAHALWSAASAGGAGSASSITNGETITFNGCSGGSSTVVGWALCSAATVGNSLVWGSATSTVISTTQTPPTVAASGLLIQLT